MCIRDSGNTDLAGLSAAIEVAFAERERPTLVIVRTSIGYGSPNKQDTAGAHGAPLGEAEVALAKENLGWPAAPPFLVPDDVLAHFREALALSLIHISEPTRLRRISYAVFCLKKKK